MDLERLRAQQEAAVSWKREAENSLRQFATEVPRIQSIVGEPGGIKLSWLFEIPSSALADSTEWRMYCRKFASLSIQDLPNLLLMELMTFTISNNYKLQVKFESLETSQIYSTIPEPGTILKGQLSDCETQSLHLDGLALPLRLRSFDPSFCYRCLWRGSSDTEKIAHAAIQWLSGKQLDSEFSPIPPERIKVKF